MTLNLPSEMDAFVKDLVVNGEFASEQEAIAEGLRLLMSREQLKKEIAIGVRQLDEGLGLDENEVFTEVYQVIDQVAQEKLGS